MDIMTADKRRPDLILSKWDGYAVIPYPIHTKQDCPNCIWLFSTLYIGKEWLDVYICPDKETVRYSSIILRYGNEPEEYICKHIMDVEWAEMNSAYSTIARQATMVYFESLIDKVDPTLLWAKYVMKEQTTREMQMLEKLTVKDYPGWETGENEDYPFWKEVREAYEEEVRNEDIRKMEEDAYLQEVEEEARA